MRAFKLPQPDGSIVFYSVGQGTDMKYFPRGSEHYWEGWIFRRSITGDWVSFRKATDEDVQLIEALEEE